MLSYLDDFLYIFLTAFKTTVKLLCDLLEELDFLASYLPNSL